MSELRIRPVDGEAMIADWRHVHNAVVPTAAMSRDEVRERATRNHLDVAYLGDVLVGCSTVRPPDDTATATVIARILPEYRRRGLGAALYEHALAKAKGLNPKVVETVVWGSNIEGLRFAGKLGYLVVDTYVMDGEKVPWHTLRLPKAH